METSRSPRAGSRRAPAAHGARDRRTARRTDRGAALLEFAVVVPVFLLLVMGTIDFGMTFNDYNSVRQGVREGARQVVVANWDVSGCTTGSSSERSVCLTKDRIGLDASRTRVRIKLNGTYKTGDPITVCSMYRAKSTTGMFSAILDSKVLTSKISMRLEQIDDAKPITDLAETPLPGQSWSWC